MICNEFILIMHMGVCALLTLIAFRIGREALIAFIALQSILANFLVTKQVLILGLEVTTTDVCMISAVLGINLLQEFFGASWAKRAIAISLASSCWASILLQFHLSYSPSPSDWADPAMQRLLAVTPKILLVSVAVAFITQHFERWIYAGLKVKFNDRQFTLRNVVCLSMTQAVDTVLFTFCALWGLVASLIDVIIMSLVAKLIVILALTPFMAFSMGLMKRGFIKSPAEPG